MIEVKNEEHEEKLREVGHLLLEVKCLARLGALASDSCICDDELQMQDKGRANATINKYIKFMSAIYNFMIDSDAAVRNPLACVKSLKEVKKQKD